MSSEPAAGQVPLSDPGEFSLVLGGPLYQLLLRSRLTGDAAQLLTRRIIVLALVAWVSLLLLSIPARSGWGAPVELPFLRDLEIHIRLLLALPLLILAELVVHQRTRLVV